MTERPTGDPTRLILRMLGIPLDGTVEVDIYFRINKVPTVRILRHLLPHQIIDDALATEWRTFQLVEVDEDQLPALERPHEPPP